MPERETTGMKIVLIILNMFFSSFIIRIQTNFFQMFSAPFLWFFRTECCSSRKTNENFLSLFHNDTASHLILLASAGKNTNSHDKSDSITSSRCSFQPDILILFCLNLIAKGYPPSRSIIFSGCRYFKIDVFSTFCTDTVHSCLRRIGNKEFAIPCFVFHAVCNLPDCLFQIQSSLICFHFGCTFL